MSNLNICPFHWNARADVPATFSEVPEELVIVDRSNNTTMLQILHRPDCRYVRRANPDNVFEYDCEPHSLAWHWEHGVGYTDTCKVCIPEFHQED